jgi:uncharacterized membrane protein (DUF485 family)
MDPHAPAARRLPFIVPLAATMLLAYVITMVLARFASDFLSVGVAGG